MKKAIKIRLKLFKCIFFHTIHTYCIFFCRFCKIMYIVHERELPQSRYGLLSCVVTRVEFPPVSILQ